MSVSTQREPEHESAGQGRIGPDRSPPPCWVELFGRDDGLREQEGRGDRGAATQGFPEHRGSSLDVSASAAVDQGSGAREDLQLRGAGQLSNEVDVRSGQCGPVPVEVMGIPCRTNDSQASAESCCGHYGQVRRLVCVDAAGAPSRPARRGRVDGPRHRPGGRRPPQPTATVRCRHSPTEGRHSGTESRRPRPSHRSSGAVGVDPVVTQIRHQHLGDRHRTV